NTFAAKQLRRGQPFRDLRFRLSADGISVSGVYPLLVGVSFETLWQPGVAGGKVTARLTRFRALGIPLMAFKKLLLGAIRDAAGGEGWLHVEDDSVVVDPDWLLAMEGLAVRTNLRSLRCEAGALLLEAGAPPP